MQKNSRQGIKKSIQTVAAVEVILLFHAESDVDGAAAAQAGSGARYPCVLAESADKKRSHLIGGMFRETAAQNAVY
ncbi:hypothetical protein [Stenotrophomonas maltophilia]|uniref:hypothetical protein n=1 Tax=Stenotrophomonas maltophilia TaxID=40324 RepID=UPI0012B10581|nr:hypothetical protein [Stenotrophomonas maltophilia]QGM06078.1 hypothetical protein FEO88_14890 [Stenotrophomonas maltophilia]